MIEKIEITLNDLWKALSKDYKYITMDEDGAVWAHEKEPHRDAIERYVSGGALYVLSTLIFSVEEFEGKEWDECIFERPLDCSKWIDKLCVFSDDVDFKNQTISLLLKYYADDEYPFVTNDGDSFKYCRPLAKEECLKYIVNEREEK